jgi:glycosyltransferase involved in cell wall biosynthesis
MFFRDNSKVKNRLAGHTSPIDHRQTADSARDSGHWALAARHYMEMLKANPKDVGIWLQHGHALKELGLFVDAAASYDRALSLAPNDPEIHLQRGFLAKVTGDLPAALHFLRQARELGYEPIDLVEREIRLCSPPRPPSVRPKSSLGKTLPLRVYLSSIARTPLDESGAEMKNALGAIHYSYAFIMKGYMAALDVLEIPYTILRHPEFIPNIADRSDAELNVHIGFYPPDDVRLLKGAYNVLSVAWEFERLRAESEITSYHAFANPARILGLADEIWSISTFAVGAFRRAGLQRVEVVPTPILASGRPRRRLAQPDWTQIAQSADGLDAIRWVPLAIAPNVQASVDREAQRRRAKLIDVLTADAEETPPVIFLSIFNVYDWRKQIRPLIEGFIQYSRTNRNAYLMLKVSMPSKGDTFLNEELHNQQMTDPGQLLAPYVSDRIWMTADVLTREQMHSLYDCSAFYVCTSHAEGQNLPMLEAMARGVVPVSVDHTAMADYVRPDNASVIRSELRPFTPRLASRYHMYGVSTWYTSAEEVFSALVCASEMDRDTYAARSAAATRTVADQFGAEPLRAALDRIVAQLGATKAGENG